MMIERGITARSEQEPASHFPGAHFLLRISLTGAGGFISYRRFDCGALISLAISPRGHEEWVHYRWVFI